MSRWRNAASPPSDNTWCWVVAQTKGLSYPHIFIAVADKSAAGGWSNGDTWEDFFSEVKWFWIIELPDEIPPHAQKTEAA